MVDRRSPRSGLRRPTHGAQRLPIAPARVRGAASGPSLGLPGPGVPSACCTPIEPASDASLTCAARSDPPSGAHHNTRIMRVPPLSRGENQRCESSKAVSGPTLASGPHFLCRPMAARRERSQVRIRQRWRGATEARPGSSMAKCGSDGHMAASSITVEGRLAHAPYAVDRRMDVVLLGASVPVRVVSRQRGHASPQTMAIIYALLSIDEQLDAVAQAFQVDADSGGDSGRANGTWRDARRSSSFTFLEPAAV